MWLVYMDVICVDTIYMYSFNIHVLVLTSYLVNFEILLI